MDKKHRTQIAALLNDNNMLMHKIDPDKINPDRYITFMDGDEVVGVTKFRKCNWFLGLSSHTCVRQDKRRSGIANQLLKEKEAKMREQGCMVAISTVRTDNVAAAGLLEKNGWVKSVTFFNRGTERMIDVWLKVLV